MSPVADKEVTGIHPLFLEVVYLAEQYRRVNGDTITDDAGNPGIKDAGGDKVQAELAVVVNDGVSRVITAGKTYHHPGFFRQEVDHLALPLVSPLGSNNRNNWHFLSSRLSTQFIAQVASPIKAAVA